ncbi:unnamed protein product [Blepharisma stoltei]|uniref:EF-hand domain-containing protein n=1 Tax=Blepharisma stoltei TaxID=1481888 RepID=A0AAU9KFG4_9CILI|nr:unnamed protein product [Blepharisma stoltei]
MAEIQSILNNPAEVHGIAKVIFDSFDTDHSGNIERSELKEALGMISKDCGTPPPDDEMVNELIEALDEDQDGKLNLEEFKVMVEELLKALC